MYGKGNFKNGKVISEAERRILEMMEKFASEKGLRLEVFDISSFKGRLKAWMKGVKVTPTIIVGDKKIEGEHSLKILRNELQSIK